MAAGIMHSKRSHANQDAQSRTRKAERIERVLQIAYGDLRDTDVLDIGTGSGHIASHFSPRVSSLLSVDVVDERTVYDFAFQQVQTEILPITSESIDVVITNHVIEHVDDQLLHLREIRRVMRPNGICYLATPNRFAIIEPHFKLPFLSWLPDCAATRYVRFARHGNEYDVRPLTLRTLSVLAFNAGLHVEERGTGIVRERLSRVAGTQVSIPRLFAHTLPSFVITLRRDDQTSPDGRS